MPLLVKLGKSLFFSASSDCFTDYMCSDSLACSMLWDPALEVPDKENIIQIKDRERAKLDNPFNAGKLKIVMADEKRKDKSSAVWAPLFEACSDDEDGSASSLADNPSTKQRLEVQSVRYSAAEIQQ
jgi:hypothetical protein